MTADAVFVIIGVVGISTIILIVYLIYRLFKSLDIQAQYEIVFRNFDEEEKNYEEDL